MCITPNFQIKAARHNPVTVGVMSQPMEPTDFIDVRSLVSSLKLTVPDGITVLPNNLNEASNSSELIYSGSATAVLKLFRDHDQVCANPLTAEPLPMRRDHDYTIVFPTLFFGAAYLSQNPQVMSVALSVIANYATQMMQGVQGGGNIKLSVAVETTKTKTVKKIDYDGPPSGLPEVAKIAKTIHGNDEA